MTRPQFPNRRRDWEGKGAKTISLTVELGLLKQADAYAKRRGISRAKLVAEGLRAVIGRAA